MLKQSLKHVCARLAKAALAKPLEALRRGLEHDRSAVLQVGQVALATHYRELARRGPADLPAFTEVGFRCFSQFEEDGLLLYLFAVLGATNRVAVEISAGDGTQCNTANLIVNHGWTGFLFDGNAGYVARGQRFFGEHPDTSLHPPAFTHAWITVENINATLAASGVSGDIDLLSLDIDGMDYWIWRAIDRIRPRVVVCETNNTTPIGAAITVPYQPDFVCTTPDYFGASLLAMTQLARSKGYRLVGTHRYGFNAFFVRQGLGEAFFPEVAVEACLNHPYAVAARQQRWPAVSRLPWVTV